MGKGYAEGPALEERLAALERSSEQRSQDERVAVYGANSDNPESHFLGWLGEVDPDALFAAGTAWGITLVRRTVSA